MASGKCSHRDLHGALLDAEILADVYLAMTGGQVVMHLGGEPQFEPGGRKALTQRGHLDPLRPRLRVVAADAQAQAANGARLAAIDKASSEGCLWLAEEPVG